MPAATGTRLAIVTRTRRAVPAGRLAEAGERAGGEVLARRRPGRPPRRRRRARARASSSSASETRLHERDERVVPVLAGATDEQAQVDLARRARQRSRLIATSSACERRATRPGASCSARASCGRPMRAPARRARGRGSPARRRARGRASARAPCAGARSPAARAPAAPARAPGRGGSGPTSTESTFGTGWKTVRDTGRRTRTSQASWASTLTARRRRTSRASPRTARPTSFCTIATHVVTRGQLGDRAQDDGRGDAVGQVRDDLRRRRVERGEVELHRVGEVERRVRMRRRARRAARARACGRARRRGRGATRSARCSLSTPRPPPTSSTTSSGPSSAARAITSSRFESIRKFWPRSRFGRMPNAFIRRRLGWTGRLAHQPNRRALFAWTAASSCRVGDARAARR